MEEGRARAVFFGTPEFSVACLDALYEIADVKLVVTQPDRPSGRGMRLRPPPVKLRAESLGIEVIQPTKVRTAAFAARLVAVEASVAVVVAYGRILPKAILEAPALGCVNVHASLLPRYRGAAPIQWAIIDGCKETGVCLMQMDEGMDTGPVLSCASLAIGPEETAGELSGRLSKLGAELLRAELPRFLRGELTAHPQDDAAATMAPLLEKDHGAVDWSLDAQRVADLIRGTAPWPSAFTFLDGTRLKLHRARVLCRDRKGDRPGTIVRADKHAIEVACGDGILAIDELQPSGKRRMTAAEFCAGHGELVGQRLSRGE